MPSTILGAVGPAAVSHQAAASLDLGLSTLDTAIVYTVAYADVFNYPLTPEELQRYLIRAPASLITVQHALQASLAIRRYLSTPDGFLTLRGREALVATRRRRTAIASSMWPRVERYASAIAHLPFVRMVAVSGALSVGNSDDGGDIDYFIVTEPGRLWLCRAAIIALVRLAARAGDSICPNYVVSERALDLQEHNLYTAHEFLHMVPLIGTDIYQRMRQLNAWTADFLPNAYEWAQTISSHPLPAHAVRSLMEAPLRTPVGGWLEAWEMRRKIAKFSRGNEGQGSATFCSDWCKGHFLDHGQRALDAFMQRLHGLAQA